MIQSGRPGRGEVIAFPSHRTAVSRFTLQDRLEIVRCAAALGSAGGDRLVIHDRLPTDPPEIGDWLSIYRPGEIWACCGIARQRGRILAWSSVTGEDVGPFATLREALQAMLGNEDAVTPAEEAWAARSAAVRALPRRTRPAAAACAD